MSNYSDEKFEDETSSAGQLFKLKLSVDVHSAKNFRIAANLLIKYKLNLAVPGSGSTADKNLAYHTFKAE